MWRSWTMVQQQVDEGTYTDVDLIPHCRMHGGGLCAGKQEQERSSEHGALWSRNRIRCERETMRSLLRVRVSVSRVLETVVVWLHPGVWTGRSFNPATREPHRAATTVQAAILHLGPSECRWIHNNNDQQAVSSTYTYLKKTETFIRLRKGRGVKIYSHSGHRVYPHNSDLTEVKPHGGLTVLSIRPMQSVRTDSTIKMYCVECQPAAFGRV